MPTILVEVRNVYGKELIYPANLAHPHDVPELVALRFIGGTVMTAAHTPGPWTIQGNHCPEIIAHSGTTDCPRTIAIVDPVHTPRVLNRDEAVANARLIAAAPELLEACQVMVEWDAREQDHAVDFAERMRMCIEAFDKARAAIAKATQP